MQEKIFTKLLLLDFGHPMNEEMAKSIETSLLNVLSLMSAYSKNSCSTRIGVSIVNSDIVVIKNSGYFQKNYKDLATIFNTKNTDAFINIKVTVQEYKNQLRTSLEKIISKLALHSETLSSEKQSPIHYCYKIIIQLAIVTRKTASLLNDMMKDVIKKLMGKKNLATLISKINFKIVQVSNANDLKKITGKSENIDCITCNYNNMEDLNSVFKNFLFNHEYEQKHVQIIISKEDDLTVKCDLQDYIINPAWLRLGFELCNDFTFQLSTRHSLLEIFNSIDKLEVLFRIPKSGLSTKVMFGFSRRVHPSTDNFLNDGESRLNHLIFEALCKNLADSQQGLLMKSKTKFESFEMKAYYFLTADGNTLLLNSVAPEELYLEKRPEILERPFGDDESSATFQNLQQSLRQINLLEVFSPAMFSSGLYECIKNQLNRDDQRRNKASYEKLKWKGKRANEKMKIINGSLSRIRNENKKSKCPRLDDSSKTGNRKSRLRKPSEEFNSNEIHPALLSPETVRKYRKNCPVSYQLQELTSDYDEN